MDLERSGRIRCSRIRVEIRSESDRPNYETQRYVICTSNPRLELTRTPRRSHPLSELSRPLLRQSSTNCYVLRPELMHVLGMVTDLLWADQTLLRDWVVTKVGFGFV